MVEHVLIIFIHGTRIYQLLHIVLADEYSVLPALSRDDFYLSPEQFLPPMSSTWHPPRQHMTT